MQKPRTVQELVERKRRCWDSKTRIPGYRTLPQNTVCTIAFRGTLVTEQQKYSIRSHRMSGLYQPTGTLKLDGKAVSFRGSFPPLDQLQPARGTDSQVLYQYMPPYPPFLGDKAQSLDKAWSSSTLLQGFHHTALDNVTGPERR